MIIRGPQDRAMLQRFIDRVFEQPFPAGGLEFTWRKPRRTNKQNAYYWDVVVQAVNDHLTEKHAFPYTPEMTHALLKSQFLPSYTDPATGRTMWGSTKELARSGDDGSWQEYITKIQAWAAKSGLYIPDPNE